MQFSAVYCWGLFPFIVIIRFCLPREFVRISSSSKISELLSLKSSFFQKLCLVVNLMIRSLGSDYLQDGGENRHKLTEFLRVRDWTLPALTFPLLCAHQEHNSYTGSAGWIKKRYMYKVGKGM